MEATMSEVTRAHKEAALAVYESPPPEDARWVAQWLAGDRFTVVVGSDMAVALQALKTLALAIADAEARGRAAERADVVAWLRAKASALRSVVKVGWHNAAISIEAGEHVGGADG
jgi:hypothetical protein